MVANADGSGLTDVTPTNVEKQSIVEPSWSPDGNQVVYSSNADGNYDLYTLKVGNESATRLTSTKWPIQNLDPVWSPSGKAIAFSRSGLSLTSAAAGLFQIRLDGTAASRLTRAVDGEGDVSPDYSPDGTRIAFSSDRAGNHDIYILDLSALQRDEDDGDQGSRCRPDLRSRRQRACLRERPERRNRDLGSEPLDCDARTECRRPAHLRWGAEVPSKLGARRGAAAATPGSDQRAPAAAARRSSTTGGVEQQERVTSLRFPSGDRRLTRLLSRALC